MRRLPGALHVDGRNQQARQSRFHEAYCARGPGFQGLGCCPCCSGAMAMVQRLTTFPSSTLVADLLPSSQCNQPVLRRMERPSKTTAAPEDKGRHRR